MGKIIELLFDLHGALSNEETLYYLENKYLVSWGRINALDKIENLIEKWLQAHNDL